MATGDILAIIHPLDAEVPSSAFAVQNVRNNHPTLDFDPATNWSAFFTKVLPKFYGGGGITVKVRWVAATATTGDVKWNGAFERMDVGTLDIDADSFASDQTTTSTTNATSGVQTQTSIAFTNGAQIDSLAAGDTFRFRITRDAVAAGDTMAGNAQITSIVIEET